MLTPNAMRRDEDATGIGACRSPIRAKVATKATAPIPMAFGPARRPKLQGDAPLTPWELEKVRRDAEVAARFLKQQGRS